MLLHLLSAPVQIRFGDYEALHEQSFLEGHPGQLHQLARGLLNLLVNGLRETFAALLEGLECLVKSTVWVSGGNV